MHPSFLHAAVPPLRRRGPWLRLRPVLPVLPVLLAALLLPACGGGAASAPAVAGPAGTTAEAQTEFGVQMARRGLWSEALFRFERAVRLEPRDPRLLNNLAVAYEATGKYDKALESYQRALDLAPDNRELRRNYARFVEFYQSYLPQPPEGAAEETVAGAAKDPGRPAVER